MSGKHLHLPAIHAGQGVADDAPTAPSSPVVARPSSTIVIPTAGEFRAPRRSSTLESAASSPGGGLSPAHASQRLSATSVTASLHKGSKHGSSSTTLGSVGAGGGGSGSGSGNGRNAAAAGRSGGGGGGSSSSSSSSSRSSGKVASPGFMNTRASPAFTPHGSRVPLSEATKVSSSNSLFSGAANGGVAVGVGVGAGAGAGAAGSPFEMRHAGMKSAPVFTNKQHLEPIPHHFDRRMSAYEAKRSPKRMASGTSNHTEAEPAMSFDEHENVVPAELFAMSNQSFANFALPSQASLSVKRGVLEDVSWNPVTLRFRNKFVAKVYAAWSSAGRHGRASVWATMLLVHGLVLTLFDAVRHPAPATSPLLIVRFVLSLCYAVLLVVLCRHRPAPATLGRPDAAVGLTKYCHMFVRPWTVPLLSVLAATYTICTILGVAAATSPTHSLCDLPEWAVGFANVDAMLTMAVAGYCGLSPMDFVTSSLVQFCIVGSSVTVCVISFLQAKWEMSETHIQLDMWASLVLVLLMSALVLFLNYRLILHSLQKFVKFHYKLVTSNAQAIDDVEKRPHHAVLNTLDDTITTGRLRALQAQTLQALGVGDFDTATRLSVKLQAFVRAAERLRRHHNGVHVSRSAEQEAAYARALQAASAIRITQHWMRRVMNAEGVGGLLNEPTSQYQVFLGGACNPTTWRKDTMIPALEKAGITFYNPQVDDWSPDLIELENKAKQEANVLLFVVDAMTRGIVSMNEATEMVTRGRNVVLVVEFVPVDASVDGKTLETREIKDLNRGRAYLLDLASRYGVPALSTVREASEYIVNMLKPQAPPTLALDSESKQTPEHLRRNRFQTVTPAPMMLVPGPGPAKPTPGGKYTVS